MQLSKRIMAGIKEECLQHIERQYKPTPSGHLGRVAEFWIAPNGQCWEIDNHLGHFGFAQWWLAKNGVDADVLCDSKYRPTEELQSRGWIRVSSGTVVLQKKPTQAQQDSIYDWMKNRGGEARLDGKAVVDNGIYTTKDFLEAFATSSRLLVYRY